MRPLPLARARYPRSPRQSVRDIPRTSQLTLYPWPQKRLRDFRRGSPRNRRAPRSAPSFATPHRYLDRASGDSPRTSAPPCPVNEDGLFGHPFQVCRTFRVEQTERDDTRDRAPQRYQNHLSVSTDSIQDPTDHPISLCPIHRSGSTSCLHHRSRGRLPAIVPGPPLHCLSSLD